jgi:4-hydroxy-tetrahydrodipicolinate synthase
MISLGRLLTAMVTPFDAGGKVNYKQAQKLALALLDSGSDGVVIAGTTGECATLSNSEKLKLFEEIKSAVGEKGSVIAATGNYNTAESADLTMQAEKTGVDGILLTVPYYVKPTQEGLYQHFKTIAGETGLPCILYNIPSRSVVNLDSDTVIRLSKIENISGIKEASANLEQIARIITGTEDKNFLVYSGNDGDTFPIMALGGYGVISVISHIVGRQFRQMIDLCTKGKMKEAADIHNKLLPLVSAMFVVSNPMPIKYALNYLGFNVGKPRLPLLEPDEKSKGNIENCLKKYKIDLPIKK